MEFRRSSRIFRTLFLFVLLACCVFLSVKVLFKIYYPLKHTQIISKYTSFHNIDPYLVMSIIKTESGFNADAISVKGAKGLMQITDSTGEWIAQNLNIKDFTADDLFDPETNIRMGCWYLKNLMGQFEDDLPLTLAAYNGGRGNVEKWLADASLSSDGTSLHTIPFKETDNYVKKVTKRYKIYKILYSDAFKQSVQSKLGFL